MVIENNGTVTTAYLSGEIDHHTARLMRNEIDIEVERRMPQLLIIDFSDVTFMDSSGIGLIMGRYKKIKTYGGELVISGTNDSIFKILRLAGIQKLAKIEEKVKHE